MLNLTVAAATARRTTPPTAFRIHQRERQKNRYSRSNFQNQRQSIKSRHTTGVKGTNVRTRAKRNYKPQQEKKRPSKYLQQPKWRLAPGRHTDSCKHKAVGRTPIHANLAVSYQPLLVNFTQCVDVVSAVIRADIGIGCPVCSYSRGY